MKNTLPVFAASLCLSFIPAHLFAQTDSPAPVARISELVLAADYQAAYDLGLELLLDWEGENDEFDLAFGLAAIEVGQANEAVYAFQRVASTATSPVLRDRATLELARAYFATNNLVAAEDLFKEVLEANPPVNVQQNIQAFLQLIEARKDAQASTFSFSLSSVYGSDDNINSATSNGLIDTPLIGQIELNQDGLQTQDNFSSTTFTANYSYPFTRATSLTVNATLNHLDNLGSNQFDIDSARSEVAYNWGSTTNRFRHGVSVTKVNLDQNGFQDALGLTTSWQHSGNNGWYQSVAATFSQIRYDTSAGGQDSIRLRDVDQLLVNLGVTKITRQFTHSFNLYHADEKTKTSLASGRHNGRDFSGVAYNMFYRANGRHTPYLRVSYQDLKHDDNHPVFFNTVREDSTASATIGWQWLITNSFVLTSEASYTDNKSNIDDLFQYSRFKYHAGFQFRF